MDAIAGIPLGMIVLPHVDARWFKVGLGTLLVIWCPTMLIAYRLPRLTLGHAAALLDGLVGVVGGVMGGLGGFTGPVPTLWITLRGFEKEVQRSVIQNFNLAALAATAAMRGAARLVIAGNRHSIVKQGGCRSALRG